MLNELGRAFDRQENWQRALRYYERAARADPGASEGRHNLVWRARLQLYGVMVFSVLVLAAMVGGALLLFGKTAAGFALVVTITGLVEIAKHRAEVIGALSPTAREVSKLRR